MSDTPVSPYQSCSASIYILVLTRTRTGWKGFIQVSHPNFEIIPALRVRWSLFHRLWRLKGTFQSQVGKCRRSVLQTQRRYLVPVPVQRHREGPDANVPVPVPVPVPGYRYHKLHKLIVVEYAADYGSMDAAENFCRAVRGVLPTQCEPRPRVVLLPRGLAHEAVHVVHGTPWSCIAFRTSHRATSRCTSRI